MRRNSDETIRELERLWRASGDRADELALLRALRRTGRPIHPQAFSPTSRRLVELEDRTGRLTAAEKLRAERQKEIAVSQAKGWRAADPGAPGYPPLDQVLEMLRVGSVGRSSRARVWVVYGDRVDRHFDDPRVAGVAGTPWERESGYIGRSTGPRPIFLLVPNVRSLGGRGISMDAVLEIRSTSGGTVFWRHSSYDPSLWVWETGGRTNLKPWSEYAVERLVYLAQELGLRASDLWSALGDRTSLRSRIADSIESRGEDQTRRMIEDAARGKYGNPP